MKRTFTAISLSALLLLTPGLTLAVDYCDNLSGEQQTVPQGYYNPTNETGCYNNWTTHILVHSPMSEIYQGFAIFLGTFTLMVWIFKRPNKGL